MVRARGREPNGHRRLHHRHLHGAKRVIPWVVTIAIFALIFRRVPVAKVVEALENVHLLPYLAIMLPYSVAYLLIDTVLPDPCAQLVQHRRSRTATCSPFERRRTS